VAGQGEPGEAGGFLFFVGLALTFSAVYLVGRRWTVFPAGSSLVLALVAAGAYLLRRENREGSHEQH
jgi:hypothetical protein